MNPKTFTADAGFRCGLVNFDTPRFHTPWEDFGDYLIVVDPYEVHAPSRRSDKELGRMLDLLASLEQGKVSN
jgi:hypothetical protein